MNCECCPHADEFAAAVRPCRFCDNSHYHGDAQGDARACEKCHHYPAIKKAMKPCGVCESGRLHGEVHFEAASSRQGVWAKALPNDHTPSTGVTSLQPDTEDVLRKCLAVIFDFSPMELLLIQHVIHRRTPGTFRETLVMLRDRLNTRYDLSEGSTSFRSICSIWKNKIVEKLPRIEDLFDAVINEAQTSRHTRHVTEEEFGDDQGEIEK